MNFSQGLRYARQKVTPMEPAEPGIVVLRPAKPKALLLLAICLGFTVIGAAMIVAGEGLSSWFVASFFGLGLAVSLVQFWPGASYLKLTPTGVECCSLFRRRFYPWEIVSDFSVSRFSGKKMVVFDRSHSDHPRLAAVNRVVAGASDALPDTYGLKAEDLAELLNEWRRRALS